MRLPASPSRSVFTIGIAAAAAASKLSATPFSSASAASLTPCAASSALLAVTTDLPAPSAASTAALAGSPAPPINSTNTSISGERAQRDRVGEPLHLLQIDAAVLAARTRRDRHDLDRASAARGQLIALARHQGHQGGADIAQAGDAKFQRCSHCNVLGSAG